MADILPFRTPTPLEREAIAELAACLAAPHGSINGVPYDDLDRQLKLELLDLSVDWAGYVGRGLGEDVPELLMFNAVDGKPPGRWLEQTPAERTARAAELAGYAAEAAAAMERISATIAARERARVADPLVVERNPFDDSFDRFLARMSENAPQRGNGRGRER